MSIQITATDSSGTTVNVYEDLQTQVVASKTPSVAVIGDALVTPQIKSIGGVTALSLDETSGAVTVADNLTIAGAVTVNNDSFEIISTDAGATVNPILSLYRNSASPAASDDLGAIQFYGEDDGGNKTLYAQIHGHAEDETGGTEDGQIHFSCVAGATLEDPVMKLTRGSLVLSSNNDLLLGQNSNIRFETDGNDEHETILYCVQATQDNTVLLPDNSGVLEIGALGSGAVVTGTSIAHGVFTNYRGQKVVFTGSSACTIGLPDAAAGDIGATWTVCNAGSANVIFDLDASAAQTVKILTGASVVTVGTDNPHIIPGGVASLICTAADNYILFGSGVVDN